MIWVSMIWYGLHPFNFVIIYPCRNSCEVCWKTQIHIYLYIYIDKYRYALVSASSWHLRFTKPLWLLWWPDSATALAAVFFLQRIGLAASLPSSHVAVYHWDWLCGFTGLGTETCQAGWTAKQFTVIQHLCFKDTVRIWCIWDLWRHLLWVNDLFQAVFPLRLAVDRTSLGNTFDGIGGLSGGGATSAAWLHGRS